MTGPNRSSETGQDRATTGNPVIGAKVREARLKKGFSQAKLGKLVGGVSKSAVSQWERGDIAIDRERLPLLSSVLEVEVEEISEPYPGLGPLTEQERILVERFRKLSGQKRESLLVILAGL